MIVEDNIEEFPSGAYKTKESALIGDSVKEYHKSNCAVITQEYTEYVERDLTLLDFDSWKNRTDDDLFYGMVNPDSAVEIPAKNDEELKKRHRKLVSERLEEFMSADFTNKCIKQYQLFHQLCREGLLYAITDYKTHNPHYMQLLRFIKEDDFFWGEGNLADMKALMFSLDNNYRWMLWLNQEGVLGTQTYPLLECHIRFLEDCRHLYLDLVNRSIGNSFDKIKNECSAEEYVEFRTLLRQAIETCRYYMLLSAKINIHFFTTKSFN